MDETKLLDLVGGQVFGVWFLVGAALVFFMQCGFAMVETGFTRAKNAGNIIMKNLMDFCIGTVVFILIGFSLLLGEDWLGLIGKPGFDIFSDYANFNWSGFVFNLVFCATAATIVSGAMGYISYDYGREKENVAARHPKEVDMPDLILCFYDNFIIEDHQEKRFYLVANGKD